MVFFATLWLVDFVSGSLWSLGLCSKFYF